MKITNRLVNLLGVTKTSDKSFYKEVDWPYMYNWCEILVIQDDFVSIIVGKKNTEIRKSVLSMCYLKDESELLFLLSRLGFLQHLFPNIVQVPTIKIKCQ